MTLLTCPFAALICTILWIVYLLIKDPKSVVRAALSKKK